MSKYVNLIGYEAEGLFSSVEKVDEKFAKVEYDGSIQCRNSESKNFLKREIVTRPFTIEEIDSFFENGGTILPNRVNDSCGGHVHISLTSKGYYGMLANENFANASTFFIQNYFIENCGSFTKTQLMRIIHGTKYCQIGTDSYTIQNQIEVSAKSHCRYHAINFCERLHGTIEFRLVPAFSVRQKKELVQFIKALVQFIENYLFELEDNYVDATLLREFKINPQKL